MYIVEKPAPECLITALFYYFRDKLGKIWKNTR